MSFDKKTEILRTLENLLRVDVSRALTTKEILRELEGRLVEKGVEPITSERALKDYFNVFRSRGIEVKSDRVKCDDVDESGKPRSAKYVRYFEDIRDTLFPDEIAAADVEELKSSVEILDRINANPFIDEIRVLLSERLELNEGTPELTVHLDSKENYMGKKYIAPIFKAIREKQAIRITYKPFYDEAFEADFSPYLLKQYNHRWYCIGIQFDRDGLQNLALDRITGVIEPIDGYQPSGMTRGDWNDRFQEIVGVTHTAEWREPEMVHLRFYGPSRGFVATKPLAFGQRPISPEDLKQDPMDVYIEDIYVNFELKQQIMFYLDQVEVVSPDWLRREIHDHFRQGMKRNGV